VVDGPAAGQAALGFGSLLRRLRDEAGLTQDELAEAAQVSQRAISDLERGINATARKDTAVLLAGALGLDESARELFVAAARGRAPTGDVLAAAAGVTGAGPSAAATRTLPRDIATFTGRQDELKQLMARWTAAEDSGGVVSVHAIGGMAGIGKTTFAVHAAHQLADRFPDGQFFLPLHAHTPGQRPVEPADALASLLLTAGVPAAQIPPGVDARAPRWRDYVAGKKILLVLDDAAGHEQVRPLLPGSPGSLVLITSRRRLAALEDAAVLSLNTLTPDEAAGLLARLADRADVTASDSAVGELAALCGYLPLAIGMLARQLHHHPAWTAAGVAADLVAARDRLELMHAENLSVAAAFDLSYRDLTDGQRRLFRRLGLHPGPDIDPCAAAALDDISLAAARRHLEGLYDQHLITEPARDRYRLHDLVREHAQALAAADDLAASQAAIVRLLDYYLHTALAANGHIATSTPAARRQQAPDAPAWTPELSTPQQAADWLGTELPNLYAAASYAAAAERPRYAVAIPAAIGGFLRVQGHWDQSAALHQTALDAARHAGDRLGQAGTIQELGILAWLVGDYSAAAARLTQALALYRDLGERDSQGWALNHLGIVQQQTGDYPAAAASQQQALELFRDLENQTGQANALNDLGIVQQLTGDYPAAAASQQQALELFRGLGNQLGQASALNQLGIVQQLTGDYPAAAASHQQALGLFRDLGVRLGEAEALNHLGELLFRSSASQQARDHHAQALAIARQINAPIAEARALEGIGHCQIQDGDRSAGTGQLQQALAIYQRIGAPDTQRVQETLRDLGT
jgi:transcriptional regulator with XRE-family HTH domain/tetratricopeptide (TPR) repeat protein